MQKIVFTFILLSCFNLLGQYQTHSLLSEKSSVLWKGSYAFQFAEHSGIVSFKKGELYTEDGHIVGGVFYVDMTTIADDPNSDHNAPIEHIRDEDFFDVAKYPEASITMTSVTFFEEENTHLILGDLTIKGITKPVKFYADVNSVTEQLTTKLKIDRTRWGITYNNKLKEKAIDDAIELYVTLQF